MAILRIVVLLLAAWLPQAWGAAPEPMQLKLLRTVYIGAPQLPLAEIHRYTKDPRSEYYAHILARAALIALGERGEWSAAQSVELLERSIEMLDIAQPSLFTEDGMRVGFGTDDVLFTLLYALVQNGQGDQAVAVLSRHLDAPNEFSRAVVLQALRYIGTPRSSDMLKGESQENRDAMLRANLLADTYFPFFDDIYRRQSMIPRDQRDRHSLLTIAQQGCGERASLAIHFLGFFAPAAEAAQQQAELAALRTAAGLGCYYSRNLAIRALALRRDGDLAFWTERYRLEQDPWIRGQIVRNAYILFGRSFLKPSLELLETEPAQYIQWELMHSNLAIRRSIALRDEWDLWAPATLQFRFVQYNFANKASRFNPRELLVWLDQGKRPQDRIVRNIMLEDIAHAIKPEHTRLFLRALHRQPEKTSAWWILGYLDDPDALPMLRYWATLPASKDQLDSLNGAIRMLEQQISPGQPDSAPACCQPDRACLLTQLHLKALTVDAPRIVTEKQALAWLNKKSGKTADADIRFTDTLERVAEVRLGTAAPQHWEHLYGCWQRVDIPAQ